MADVTLTFRAAYDKSGRVLDHQAVPYEYDLDEDGVTSLVLTATQAAAYTVPLGDITPYMGIFQNLDATNYIELGYDDTGFAAVMRIQPGAFVVVDMQGVLATPQVKANTADCKMAYTILQPVATA